MRRLIIATVVAAVVLAVGLGAGAGKAFAIPTLTITDGITTITILDGGGGDGCANVGCVTFNGAVGNWIINVVTGLTKPVLGSANLPHMDINFTDVYNGSTPSTLTILWSDTGFSTAIPMGFVSDIGGTRASGVTSVSYADFASASNAINALTTALCAGSFTATAFSSTCVATYGVAGVPYSLTERIVLTATGPGQSSGDHSVSAVPEPGALLLVGSALVGIGLAARVGSLRRRFGRTAA